LVIVLPRIQDW